MALVAYRIEPTPVYTAPKIALGCALPPLFVALNPTADCGASSAMMTMLLVLVQGVLFYSVVARYRYAQHRQ